MEWKPYPIGKDFQTNVYTEIPLPLKISLYRRGIKTEDEVLRFFYPELKNMMEPEMLPNISSAAEVIADALKSKKKILIWGDEDVDGITGTMILYKTLKKLDANVGFYIPNRAKEGVGLTLDGIKNAIKKGVNLLITVDCGSSNIKEVQYARKNGLSVIITDHHEIPDSSSAENFLINPKLNRYPFPELSGAVISFKLSYIIIKKEANLSLSEWLSIMPEMVTYAGLSVISDRVPLINDNRIIFVEGVKQLSRVKEPGLSIISQYITKIEKFYEVISYLQSGKQGMLETFFLERDKNKAVEIFRRMEIQHKKWTAKARSIYNTVSSVVEKDGYISFIKGVDPEFLGYCASRLKDFTGMPVILIGERNGEYIGEGRAPKGFNLVHAFQSASENLIKYGGHKVAAGFTIKPEAIKTFLGIMKERIMDYSPKNEKFVDSEVEVDELDKNFFDVLKKFPPYGEGNPEPIFMLNNVVIQKFEGNMFIDNNGLKLFIGTPNFIEQDRPLKLIFSLRDNGKIKIKDWEYIHK